MITPRLGTTCPTVADLPPPPHGKTGFPWTEASTPLSHSEDVRLPRVTIVTPSYNQGQFIEETIRSVLLQEYDDLEYIIFDGGSTDDSVEIIRKYEHWLTFWTSEPDHGQADAVGKGWVRGTGTILAYLNSDDTYLPNAIRKAVCALTKNVYAPAVCGGELLMDTDGIVFSERLIHSATWHDLIALNFVPQPAIFLRREAYERAGGLDYNYHNSFDFELWTRIAQLGDFVCLPELLAATRWHQATKTVTRRPQIVAELQQIVAGILASPAGRALPWCERRYIRARLNYVLLGVYLDNPTNFATAVIANYFSALWHWIPIAPLVSQMLISTLFYRVVLFYLRVVKHKAIPAQSFQSSTGTHWSIWQSRQLENNLAHDPKMPWCE